MEPDAPPVGVASLEDSTNAQQAAKQKFTRLQPDRKRKPRYFHQPHLGAHYALLPQAGGLYVLLSTLFDGPAVQHPPRASYLLLDTDLGARPCQYRDLPMSLRDLILSQGLTP